MRLTLPDNQWADIRDDISKAPRRLTKAIAAVQAEMTALPSFTAIRKAAQEARETGKENAAKELSDQMSAQDIPLVMPLMERLKEAQVLALVTAWSFEAPLTAESLDELPTDVFNALVEEAEKRSVTDVSSKAALLDPTPALEDSNA